MVTNMRIVYLILLFILNGFLWGQEVKSRHHAQLALDCNECHVCKTPTYERPCLKIFPDFTRERGITIYNSAEDAPEILKIGIISDLYEPSIFTHKLHAEMADMAGGCIFCHHNNPPGRIAACRECHKAGATGTDINRLGLKGAYHRQCLNCHRQWSQTNDCIVCHELKGSARWGFDVDLKAAFRGKKHPAVKEPDKLVYQTGEDDAPIVTFYHDAHAQQYGLKCVDCHRNESCSRCHDSNNNEKQTAKRDAHENCLQCHQNEIDEGCAKCHDTRERPPFEHAKTGFALRRYHQNLPCQKCHRQQTTGRRLSGKCGECHGQWDNSNFNHAVTGLVLDDNHIDNTCDDCHKEKIFDAIPKCDDCHDDINYPDNLPGKRLK